MCGPTKGIKKRRTKEVQQVKEKNKSINRSKNYGLDTVEEEFGF